MSQLCTVYDGNNNFRENCVENGWNTQDDNVTEETANNEPDNAVVSRLGAARGERRQVS